MFDAPSVWTILGIGISLWAMRTALNVSKAVDKMVRRANAQTDADSVRAAIDHVDAAKDAAKRRQASAPAVMTQGRRTADDLALVIDAEDSLRTRLPPAVSPTLRATSNSAADDIRLAVQEINNGNTVRDGWGDALAALSIVIPELEREHRRLKDETLTLN